MRPFGCICDSVGEALPVWRIRRLSEHFDRVNDLGPDTANWTAKREIWSCRSCRRLFALVRVPEKDEQDYLVRTPDDDWPRWDWIAIVEATARIVGWRGEASGEEKFVL